MYDLLRRFSKLLAATFFPAPRQQAKEKSVHHVGLHAKSWKNMFSSADAPVRPIDHLLGCLPLIGMLNGRAMSKAAKKLAARY